MGEIAEPLLLNLGCGGQKLEGFVNVDLYGSPDVRWDLQEFPYPWDDDSVDHIEMWHTLEHLPDWWSAFIECSRILKPGGTLNIRVPDESDPNALAYRDHFHVFTSCSFDAIAGGVMRTTNEWFLQSDRAPLEMVSHQRIPHERYFWLDKPLLRRVLRFCADHLRGFIREQRFSFRKVG